MVWNTLASPSTGPRHAGRRVSNTPSGTPMATASRVEAPTSARCWPNRPKASRAWSP